MFNLFKKREQPNFRFTESENTACFTCDHVLNRERPILHVTRDEDGDWQFMCGQNDHTEANAKIISLKQVTEIDQSVNDLFEMPLGVGADRASVNEKWQPFRLK